MLRRPAEEAEGHLLSATPPLVYRAVKLHIRAGRWARALELAQQRRAHVDTVLAYRARYLAEALGGAPEPLLAFRDAAATLPSAASGADWSHIKARKDAEKAAEKQRPGARALPLVAALQVRLGAAEGKGGE
jgi:intraflagellar transport protein 80